MKHGVETGDFIDSNRSDFANLSNLVHGRQWEPSSVLSLCQIQQRNHRCLLVVVGVFGQDVLDSLVVLGGEIKVSGLVVVRCIDVLRTDNGMVNEKCKNSI